MVSNSWSESSCLDNVLVSAGAVWTTTLRSLNVFQGRQERKKHSSASTMSRRQWIRPGADRESLRKGWERRELPPPHGAAWPLQVPRLSWNWMHCVLSILSPAHQHALRPLRPGGAERLILLWRRRLSGAQGEKRMTKPETMCDAGEGCTRIFFVFLTPEEMRGGRMTAVWLRCKTCSLARSCRGNGELKERNRFIPLMPQKSSLVALRSEAVKSSLNQEQ